MRTKEKNLLLCLMVVAVMATLAFFALSASATTYTGDCGDNAVWSYDTQTYELSIYGSGAIDSYIDGKAPWSAYNYFIKNITISDKVTSIDKGTFSGCAFLESITLPFVGGSRKTESDTYQYPFGYIFGESSYTGSVATVQYYYGSSTSSTTNSTYYIPSSLKSVTVTGGNILGGAFYNCSNLTSITIPDNVTSIGESAFLGCSSLTNITIPDSVTSIGMGAFSGCSSLESMTMPFVGGSRKTASDTYQYPFGYIFGESSYTGSVATTQEYYGGSTSFTTSSTYHIPSGLTSVTITDGDIPYGAFYNCLDLTSITISDSVTSIGSYAFYYCINLTSIIIPDSITSIGDSTFHHCSNLTSINVDENNPSYCSIDGILYNKNKTTLIAAPRAIRECHSIPDSVTRIGDGAFYNCSDLKSITIPDSVTSIGDEAFYWITVLSSISLPDGLTSIGSYAFYYCINLTSITIPDSVTNIGDYAFYKCTGLTSISLGKDVSSIGDYAFYWCTGLTSINVDENNPSYCSIEGILYDKNKTNIIAVPGAIKECHSIPDSVTSIGDEFYWHSSLTSITIPDSVTSIGMGAFQGCSSLESITLPFVGGSRKTASDTYQYPFGYIFGESSYTGSVSTTQYYYGSSTSYVDRGRYYIPYSLKSVTITGGNILHGAFYDCDTLNSVTLGNGVASIGSSAFEGCDSLTSITIPDSVTSIGGSAFGGCDSLNEVYYKGDLVGWCNIDFENEFANPLYYGANLYINNVLLKNAVIPDTATVIKDYAFYNYDELGSITIPDSVTSIGSYAFSGCYGLWSITILDGVASIGSYAFYDCINLTSIIIPDSVTSIGDSTFCSCSNLRSVYIGNSVTSIGCSAFLGCSSLTSITIPDSVASIGMGAFSGCSSLKSLTLPFVGGSRKTESDTYQYPFGYIFGKSSYTGADETTQKYYENASSTDLETYYIPSSLKSVTITGGNILYGAFDDCDTLNSVTLGNGVTSIGEYAFFDCDSLRSVSISDSVTSIDWMAFRFCSELTYAYIFRDSAAHHHFLYEYDDDYSDNYTSSSIRIIFVEHPEKVEFNDDSKNIAIGLGKTKQLNYTVAPENVFDDNVNFFSSDQNIVTVDRNGIVTGVNIGNATIIIITEDSGRTAFCNVCVGYTVTYNANGGKGAPSAQIKVENVDLTLSSTIPTRVGYTFSGWSTEAEGDVEYEAGDTYSANADTTLYAVWEPDTYTVVFKDAESGEIYKEELLAYGSVIIPPENPTKDGLFFAGWDGWSNGMTVNKDIEFTAIWHTEGEWIIDKEATATTEGSKHQICSVCGYTIRTEVIPKVTEIIGSCGENLTWKLDLTTETLTISGTGEMDDYTYSMYDSLPPWKYRNIKKVIIEDGVTSIGNYAFYGCSNLTSVEIPDSVTSIGVMAFYKCSSLKNLYITDLESWLNVELNRNDSNPLYSAGGNLYIDGVLATDIEIPDTVTSISYCAFYNCDSLTSVEIPDSVTSIGWSAFSDCSSLTSVEIPDSVTSIDEYAFYNCSSLTSVEIGDSVTSIGDEAFYGCRSLTSVEIPDSVTSIGWSAFEDCSSLASIEIPDSVTSIGNYAFRNCRSLKTIYLYRNSAADSYFSSSYTKIYLDVYTISYDLNGGSGTFNSQTKKDSENIYLNASIPVKEGYNFKGWQGSDGKTYVAGVSYSANKDLVLTAIWEEKTYSVTYDANGGTNAPTTQTKYYFSDLTLSSVFPTKTGYDFIEWQGSNGKTYDTGESYSVNANLTLTAIWKVQTYTLTFDALGGNLDVTHKQITFDSIYGDLPTPTKANYTFGGWFFETGYQNKLTSDTVVTIANDHTAYAMWIPVKYTVIYYVNGGEDSPASQTKDFGINLVLSNVVPTRKGYKFLGWSTTADGAVRYAPGATYSENVPLTLYAVWEKTAYGDTNGDGEVDIRDVVLLAQYLAGWEVELDLLAADCNGDGEADIRDVVLLAQYLAGWDVTLG